MSNEQIEKREGQEGGNPTPNRLNEIQGHLEADWAALEKDFGLGPKEKLAILKSRAKALAKEAEKSGDGEVHLNVVEFLLAHEKYALELKHIREVYQLKELTPLPGTPPFVLGLINVRGQILSVIDLKRFFELPDQGLAAVNQAIILHSDEMEVSILADAILGMKSIPINAIQPSLPTLTGIRAEYLKGITGDRVTILDGGKILSDKNILVHQEKGTGSGG